MLRTRAPLSWKASSPIPSDLHVLGLPLAFILSQDQTLHCKMFCLSLTLLLIIESVFDELVSVNLHSLPLLNRVSLYSFPLSYNAPEGFSFRSLRYMIFYFLKELFRFPFTVPLFIFSHSLRRDQNFISCPSESLRLLSFLSGSTLVFPSFVLPPNSLWLSLLPRSASPPFFLPSFRECKGSNLFFISKTFFSFLYSKF